MVGGIYFINMPYSDFSIAKGRPVLVFYEIDKNDCLILPLTTNLARNGVLITNDNLKSGSLKKQSVIIVPKITAIDKSLINVSSLIANLNNDTLTKVAQNICQKLNC